MLVRNQDRSERFRSHAHGRQTLKSLLAREPCIDQQARAFRGNKGAIAGAGRREYGELDDDSASSPLDAEMEGRSKRWWQKAVERRFESSLASRAAVVPMVVFLP